MTMGHYNLCLVPPHPPTVYSADGKRMSEVLGPYKLGSALEATCVNSGGLPAPRLSWWREGVMIDDTYEEVMLTTWPMTALYICLY